MDPDTDVCQTEQPQISYSVDFTAEQSSAMGSPILLDREGTSTTITLASSLPDANLVNLHGLVCRMCLSTLKVQILIGTGMFTGWY